MEGSEYPPYTTGWSQELYGVTLPEGVEYPVYMLTRYWTQGYQGLSECLDLPFKWCYGLGHSTFLMRYAGVFAANHDYFLQRSYPYRLEAETGYDVSYYWHTIYPWLASDLTFPGALVAVGLLAALLREPGRIACAAKIRSRRGFWPKFCCCSTTCRRTIAG